MRHLGKELGFKLNKIDSGQDSIVSAEYDQDRQVQSVEKMYKYDLEKRPEMKDVILRYLLDTEVYKDIANGDSEFDAELLDSTNPIKIKFHIVSQGDLISEDKRSYSDILGMEQFSKVITQKGQIYMRGYNLEQYFTDRSYGYDDSKIPRRQEERAVEPEAIKQMSESNEAEKYREEIINVLKQFVRKLNDKAKERLEEIYSQAGLPKDTVPKIGFIDLRNVIAVQDEKDQDTVHFMITDTASKMEKDYSSLISYFQKIQKHS